MAKHSWTEEQTVLVDDWYREHGLQGENHSGVKKLAKRVGKTPVQVAIKLRDLHAAHGNPPEGSTPEYWQHMSRNLLECIQNVLGAYGADIDEELPASDIALIVSGTGDLDTDFSANLANLRLCAVEEYKARHGIKRCKCGREDIVGTALSCKVCQAEHTQDRAYALRNKITIGEAKALRLAGKA